MNMEDLDPRNKKPALKDLDVMSIKELHEYISGLKAEIVRAEGAIAIKGKVRLGAEAAFKR